MYLMYLGYLGGKGKVDAFLRQHDAGRTGAYHADIALGW